MKLNFHFHFLQYVAEKIHCVWLADGETNILFECKDFDGPEHLGSTVIDCIANKKLVEEYLSTMECIPHFHWVRTMSMESTVGLFTKLVDSA